MGSALAWSRSVFPCSSLDEFLQMTNLGCFADELPADVLHPRWSRTDGPCQGTGWDWHPPIFGPGHRMGHRMGRQSVAVSGEIRDGKGHRPSMTFEVT